MLTRFRRKEQSSSVSKLRDKDKSQTLVPTQNLNSAFKSTSLSRLPQEKAVSFNLMKLKVNDKTFKKFTSDTKSPIKLIDLRPPKPKNEEFYKSSSNMFETLERSPQGIFSKDEASYLEPSQAETSQAPGLSKFATLKRRR